MREPSGGRAKLLHMATVTLRRSDLFPVATSVGIYPAGAKIPDHVPVGSAIASAAVDAAGVLNVSNAGILSGRAHVAYALVAGEHRYATVRSTVDVFDAGTVAGTGDTTNGSATVSSTTVSLGAFQAGMRITGPGIPAGTFILTVSGATLTLSAAATATASTVVLRGDGAYAWRARLRRRRVAMGTS